MHPAKILFTSKSPPPVMPVVNHYAGSEKLMCKSLSLQNETAKNNRVLFDLSCDCEDGAPAGAESEHAEMIAALINSTDNQFNHVASRIHDITHPQWENDLDILVKLAGQRIAFITLPKVGSVHDVKQQIDTLRSLEKRYNLTRQIPVHILIETHGAMHDIWEIAALPDVQSLDFGLMDFVSDHFGAIPDSAMCSPNQFEHPLIVRAKCKIVSAALANEAIPTHNVSTEIKDQNSINKDAQRARYDFGFMRMWSIHPNQISPIIDAMRPDFSNIEQASEILLRAQKANWGPIQYQGKLHDRASYRYYWHLLQQAYTTGATLPDQTDQWFKD